MNLVVHGGGGPLARAPNAARALGALAPYAAQTVRNMVTGAAQERVIQRGVEAASEHVASQVSAQVVEQISNQVLSNPSIHSEIARQMFPFMSKMVVDASLNWLSNQYNQHYYSIWTIISIMALITIRWLDVLFSHGRITNVAAGMGVRTISAGAKTALKSAKAVANAIRAIGTPRSARKKTQVLILFIFLFGLLMSTSKPIYGSLIAIAGPYLANRTMGGNNTRNVNNYINNVKQANSPQARQASPPAFGGNVPASFMRGGSFGGFSLSNRPRGGVASAFSSSTAFGSLGRRSSPPTRQVNNYASRYAAAQMQRQSLRANVAARKRTARAARAARA